jgi:hypothetical protein
MWLLWPIQLIGSRTQKCVRCGARMRTIRPVMPGKMKRGPITRLFRRENETFYEIDRVPSCNG